MYENTVHLRPTHPLEVSLLHPKSEGVFRLRGRLLPLAAKTPLGRTLPPFPASRYAELVSGGPLATISAAHISAPAGPCILRQQNMERQVGRRGSHVSGGQGAGAPKVSGSLAVGVSRFSRIIVLACYFVLRVYCWLAGGPHHYSGRWSPCCFGFTWGLVGSAKCCGSSANSLWQGGWRRAHSVKGGLPK